MCDNNEKIRESQEKFYVEELKCCHSCLDNKPENDFYFNKRRNCYYNSCKRCTIDKKKVVIKKMIFIIKDGINLKWCNKCKNYIELNNFYFLKKLNRPQHTCIKCSKQRHKIYNQKKRENNCQDYILQRRLKDKEQYEKHKDKIRERSRLRAKTASGKQYISERRKFRRKNDPMYRIKETLRSRIGKILKLKGTRKHTSTLNLLGCSILEFKIYLESQFDSNMSWSNYGYGSGKWNVEHILPCALFNFLDIEQQKACFNYKNLRPFMQNENFNKSDFLEDGRRAKKLTSIEKINYLKTKGYNFI